MKSHKMFYRYRIRCERLPGQRWTVYRLIAASSDAGSAMVYVGGTKTKWGAKVMARSNASEHRVLKFQTEHENFVYKVKI